MANKEKPDLEHLAWAIDQRAEIQRTLLALYKFIRTRKLPQYDHDTMHIFNDLVGAAFSLWRAVFLSETFRDISTIHQSQEDFLEKVITDNAIGFPDDKANRPWTVGYYLENAKFRLQQASAYSDNQNKTTLGETLRPLLHVKGTRGAHLTRHEWESVHCALRLIFKVIEPDSEIEARPPESPEAEGLARLCLRPTRRVAVVAPAGGS